MGLRAPDAGLSFAWGEVSNWCLVRAMTIRMYRALIASLSLATLTLAANDALAQRAGSAAAPARGAFAAIPRPPIAHALRHQRGHRFFGGGAFWPGDFYGPVDGGPIANVPPQPTSTDINYTYKYDVPWDWAHRFPPNVTPSDRPYVTSCPAETVTVPGRDGLDHTVNITRCY
jgi:hypothetical protein